MFRQAAEILRNQGRVGDDSGHHVILVALSVDECVGDVGGAHEGQFNLKNRIMLKPLRRTQTSMPLCVVGFGDLKKM